MKKIIFIPSITVLAMAFFVRCQNSEAANTSSSEIAYGKQFKDKVEWGQHLVTVSACHDCHSPKTADGLELDTTRLLAGHIPGSQEPEADLKQLQEKGTVVTVGSLTSWAGPWGVSYAANLTSDETGIGNWSEEHFMTALRHGKYKGMMNGRDLLPPMPWQMYRNFTDEEIKAIFAYLKSTKPVHNIVPVPKTAGAF